MGDFDLVVLQNQFGSLQEALEMSYASLCSSNSMPEYRAPKQYSQLSKYISQFKRV
jgi:hypothetical protein